MYTTQSRSNRSSTLADQLASVVRLTNLALPGVMRQQALSMGLNRAFRQPLSNGDLDFMRGRRVRIMVLDIHLDFSITLRDRQLCVSMRSITPDVIFRANLHDLLSVITGQVDPDTLFFRRKLTIEGNTELGLALKNFLDSQDPEQLIPAPAYRLTDYLASA